MTDAIVFTAPELAVASATWSDARKTIILVVTTDGRTLHVPDDPANSDRASLTHQNIVIADYVAPPTPAPTQVPMWAAQAALKAAGHYDAINAAIAQMESSNPPVYFAWTMGNYASRSSAFIASLAAQFGMSSVDIDALFVAADQMAQTAG